MDTTSFMQFSQVILLIFSVITTYIGIFMAIKNHKYTINVLFLSLFLLYVYGFIKNQVIYNYQEKIKKCQVEQVEEEEGEK